MTATRCAEVRLWIAANAQGFTEMSMVSGKDAADQLLSTHGSSEGVRTVYYQLLIELPAIQPLIAHAPQGTMFVPVPALAAP
jgi:hypothetical protein